MSSSQAILHGLSRKSFFGNSGWAVLFRRWTSGAFWMVSAIFHPGRWMASWNRDGEVNELSGPTRAPEPNPDKASEYILARYDEVTL